MKSSSTQLESDPNSSLYSSPRTIPDFPTSTLDFQDSLFLSNGLLDLSNLSSLVSSLESLSLRSQASFTDNSSRLEPGKFGFRLDTESSKLPPIQKVADFSKFQPETVVKSALSILSNPDALISKRKAEKRKIKDKKARDTQNYITQTRNFAAVQQDKQKRREKPIPVIQKNPPNIPLQPSSSSGNGNGFNIPTPLNTKADDPNIDESSLVQFLDLPEYLPAPAPAPAQFHQPVLPAFNSNTNPQNPSSFQNSGSQFPIPHQMNHHIQQQQQQIPQSNFQATMSTNQTQPYSPVYAQMLAQIAQLRNQEKALLQAISQSNNDAMVSGLLSVLSSITGNLDALLQSMIHSSAPPNIYLTNPRSNTSSPLHTGPEGQNVQNQMFNQPFGGSPNNFSPQPQPQQNFTPQPSHNTSYIQNNSDSYNHHQQQQPQYPIQLENTTHNNTENPNSIDFEDLYQHLDIPSPNQVHPPQNQMLERQVTTPVSNSLPFSEMFQNPSQNTPLENQNRNRNQPPQNQNETEEDLNHDPSNINSPDSHSEWDKKFSWSDSLLLNLSSKWGFHKFRPNQERIINCALAGNDVLALMPTGGGKSLCYQLPALITYGITIVISPLVSLIQDQVYSLRQRHIDTVYLGAGQNGSDARNTLSRLSSKDPKLTLLYLTPERLSSKNGGVFNEILDRLYSENYVARFVIDESHLISSWGHDFRPTYIELRSLRIRYPKVPLMALTATATKRVKLDIIKQLGIRSPQVFQQSFNRTNLTYRVEDTAPSKVTARIIDLITESYSDETGIVYCLSKKNCDQLAKTLRDSKISAAAYHAGMTPGDRHRVQKQWSEDDIKVICATVAFGMGIDKPDVRFVFHATIPKSIEGYYQESGRAGRDGRSSLCVLFYNPSGRRRMRSLISRDPSKIAVDYRTLNTQRQITISNFNQIVAYCENDVDCRRVQLLAYFSEKFDSADCTPPCDNCLNEFVPKEVDCSGYAKSMIKILRFACTRWVRMSWTQVKAEQLFCKSTSKAINAYSSVVKREIEFEAVPRQYVSRIISHLLLNGVFLEQAKHTRVTRNTTNTFVILSLGDIAKQNRILAGTDKVIIKVRTHKRLHKNRSKNEKKVDENAKLLRKKLETIRKNYVLEAQKHDGQIRPYHVLPNTVLDEIIEKMPTSLKEFRKVPGIHELVEAGLLQIMIQAIIPFAKKKKRLTLTKSNGFDSSQDSLSLSLGDDSLGDFGFSQPVGEPSRIGTTDFYTPRISKSGNDDELEISNDFGGNENIAPTPIEKVGEHLTKKRKTNSFIDPNFLPSAPLGLGGPLKPINSGNKKRVPPKTKKAKAPASKSSVNSKPKVKAATRKTKLKKSRTGSSSKGKLVKKSTRSKKKIKFL